MTKNEMKLLERAYAAEIDAALNGSPHVMQTRSKLVDGLVSDGYLRRAKIVWHGVAIEGYELTQAGNLAYCISLAQ